jgi:hypothetical protein
MRSLVLAFLIALSPISASSKNSGTIQFVAIMPQTVSMTVTTADPTQAANIFNPYIVTVSNNMRLNLNVKYNGETYKPFCGEQACPVSNQTARFVIPFQPGERQAFSVEII